MFDEVLRNVNERQPLVHCITNYVTVNDCANIVLACGGSPIMADASEEVEEIVALCTALVINLGTLNEPVIRAMIKAGKQANALGLPVILDPVGVGASKLRTDTVFNLLQEVDFSVIRGNISEIKTIYQGSGNTRGVDAAPEDRLDGENVRNIIASAGALAVKTGAVIAISGATDVVTDGQQTYIITNGHPMMSRITGTGCMLAAVIGAWCGANPGELLRATAGAVSALGLCGEVAWSRLEPTQSGTGSFGRYLIDAMSNMTVEVLRGGAKLELV